MAADAETDSATAEEAMNVIGEWSPKAQAFLDELMALCSKHGVFLATDYSTIEVRSIGDHERAGDGRVSRQKSVLLPLAFSPRDSGGFAPSRMIRQGLRITLQNPP